MATKWKSLSILVVFWAIYGCSAESNLDASFADTARGNSSNDTDSSLTDTSVITTVDASHYAISGVLDVVAGDLVLPTTLLNFAYSNPDLELQADPLCAADHALDAAAQEVGDFDVDLFGWWQVTTPSSIDCAAAQYPAPLSFKIGIGPYDPLLDPAAFTAGIDGASVYGLYLQLDEPERPLLVFGLAGTPENYAGIEVPVGAAPLPDGVYSLQTLHLLPLE